MKFIFEGNYINLNKTFERYQEPKHALEGARDFFKSEEMKKNIIRHMFNFFVSAKTLIEFLEKFCEKEKVNKINIIENDLIINYIDIFNKSNFGHFIRQFRNYIIHESLPFIHNSLEMQFDKGIVTEMNNNFYINILKMKLDRVFSNKKDSFFLDSLPDKYSLIKLSEKIYYEYKGVYKFFKYEMMKIQIDKAYEILKFKDENGEIIEPF